MMTELDARRQEVLAQQKMSDALEKGTEAYTSLQTILNDVITRSLPEFKEGLEGVTKVLEWLVPSSYSKSGSEIWDSFKNRVSEK
jgi:hypothetical protein